MHLFGGICKNPLSVIVGAADELYLVTEISLQNVPFVTRGAALGRPLHRRMTVNVVDHGGNAGPNLVTESREGINGPKLRESLSPPSRGQDRHWLIQFHTVRHLLLAAWAPVR